MNRLLTAVGHFHIEKRNKGGKIPVVILKNREYILDIGGFSGLTRFGNCIRKKSWKPASILPAALMTECVG